MMSIFNESDVRYCSVPIPAINDHKGSTFDFTEAQISAYKQSQTHPSIVYSPDKFGGHEFWLATTPYPSSVGCFENPCIYYADFTSDGKPPVVFTPISGGTANGLYTITNNPITKITENTATNSDCDIVIKDSVMYMISRDNVQNHKPFVQKSENGFAWTVRDANPLWTESPEKVSPSIVVDDNNIYVYSITGNVGNYYWNKNLNRGYFGGITRHVGTTLDNGGNLVYDLKINLYGARTKIAPWHLDVVKHDTKWYMVYCAKNRNREIDRLYTYLAVSDDGVNFYAYAQPLLDYCSMYRPTICIDENNNLIVYFSTVGRSVDASKLPNGSADVSTDGRYIGVVYDKLSNVLLALEANKLKV